MVVKQTIDECLHLLPSEFLVVDQLDTEPETRPKVIFERGTVVEVGDRRVYCAFGLNPAIRLDSDTQCSITCWKLRRSSFAS